jgi:hypothetical protein
LLFPTSIAGNPDETASGPSSGSLPVPVIESTQVAAQPMPTQVAMQPMPTRPPTRAISNDVASAPTPGSSIASSTIADRAVDNRGRAEELGDCIEDRVRNRARNRDNRGQGIAEECQEQPGNLASNPASNATRNQTNSLADEMTEDLGEQISNDVDDRLRAAGIDPDD